MTDRLNEVQKIINGYFDGVDCEAFGRFRADFSFGKMLRSKLLLSIAPNSSTALKVCAIIELIHFASLLHDDVIDSANLRRGKQSINAKYGDKNAIMLGDILYSKAFYEVACIPCVGANLSQIISNAVFRLSLGELDDVFLGESINLDDKKYLKMVERKTAALIEASAVCGGILKSDLPLGFGNSPLGLHSADLANFGEQQTTSLVVSPKFTKNHESQTENPSVVDSADLSNSQNLNKNNPRVSAHLESRPLRGAKNRIQASSSATADFLLEAESRGSPPKSEKAAAFWGHNKKELGGARRGVQPFLREESSENNGSEIAESSLDSAVSQNLKNGLQETSHSLVLPRRFCESARNDEYILDSAINKYKIYGRNLGIAFQIIDDLLDITQEDSTLGKESFSDFKEGKTTLPYIYLYSALNASDKEILKSYFKKSLDSSQKGWIRAKMGEFEIIQKVKNIAQDYGKMALSVLDSSDESDKNLLKIITDMIDREF